MTLPVLEAAINDLRLAHREETLRLLSSFPPEHLSTSVTLADGSTRNVIEYAQMFTRHVSEHTGQFVAASRASRRKAQ